MSLQFSPRIIQMHSVKQYYDQLQYRYQHDEKFWRQCQTFFIVSRYVTFGGVIAISLFLYFTSCAYAPSVIRPLLLPCWFVSYKQNEAIRDNSEQSLVQESNIQERSIDLTHLRNKVWDGSLAYTIPFPIPDPNGALVSQQLMEQEWVLEVATTVQSFPSKLATVVVLTGEVLEMFLNWFIFVHKSATDRRSVLVDNLLVVSLDPECSRLLERYSIGHVELEPDLISFMNQSSEFAKTSDVNKVHTCKFLVAWLLNYIGYSALLVDLDAIILQDIDHITQSYPEYDVIAGRDRRPQLLAEKWGETMSSGFLFIKASRQIEMLWRTIHLANYNTLNQHNNLNYALYTMGVSWNEDIHSKSSLARGVTLQEKISILLLPETVVCRRCDKDSLEMKTLEVYHVYEPTGLKDKVRSMQEIGHWKLRIDWRDCLEDLSHTKLMHALPNLSVDQQRGPCNSYE